MAEITASLVKELREKTGAGMMECKKVLEETSGDKDKELPITKTIKFNGEPAQAFNTDNVGRYTITYKIIDKAGNESEELTRTVTIIDFIDDGKFNR